MNHFNMAKENIPPEEDFRDVGFVAEVMVSDDEERLEKLKIFLRENGMEDADIEASIGLQRLREREHKEMKVLIRKRAIENTEPTPEELSMGAYAEMIEPHVRDAVFELRRKGYNTISSGFADFNYQSISCADQLVCDSNVLQRLADIGVTVTGEKKNSLTFQWYNDDLSSLTRQWDAIVDILPDKGASAPDSPVSLAETFRKMYRAGHLQERYGGPPHAHL